MKTILVPTDFSKEAKSALNVAAGIAERSGAVIKLLHIVEGNFGGGFSSSGNFYGTHQEDTDDLFTLKLLEKSKKQLEKEAQRHQDLKIEPVLKVGSVFKNISSQIAENKVDLIVMGTHGEGAGKEFSAGSNTVKVVRKASTMVLAVKAGIENFFIKKVVVATDFKNISETFIEKLKELQEIFSFKIYLLFVNTQLNFMSTEELEKLAGEFRDTFDLKNAEYDSINAYEEERGILQYSEKKDADVIVLTTHARKGLNLLLFGSISEGIVEHAGKPVLTYKID